MPAAADEAAIILAGLPVEVAARLAVHMMPSARRAVRDRAIASLRGRYSHLARTAAARAIARDLAAAERAPERDPAAALVVSLNGGRGLGARQLVDLLAGWRGW